MTDKNCSVCGSENYQLVKHPFDTTYKGTFIQLKDIEMYYCSDCTEEVFTPEQAREVTRQVKEKQLCSA